MKSPRPFWNQKHCGKVCHGSRAEAELVRDRMVAERRVSSGELEVYRCDVCKFFHLGHPIGWSRKKFEAWTSRARGRA